MVNSFASLRRKARGVRGLILVYPEARCLEVERSYGGLMLEVAGVPFRPSGAYVIFLTRVAASTAQGLKRFRARCTTSYVVPVKLSLRGGKTRASKTRPDVSEH